MGNIEIFNYNNKIKKINIKIKIIKINKIFNLNIVKINVNIIYTFIFFLLNEMHIYIYIFTFKENIYFQIINTIKTHLTSKVNYINYNKNQSILNKIMLLFY